MPGLVLAFSIAMAGPLLANLPNVVFGFDQTPLSPILVSILLGLFLRNAVGLPVVYQAGLELALKKILRVGVALLGLFLGTAIHDTTQVAGAGMVYLA